MTINDFEKINVNVNTSQSGQYLVMLENRNPIDYYKLYVKDLKLKNHKRIYDKLQEDDRLVIELDFCNMQDTLKRKY